MADINFIKKARAVTSYTPEQLLELSRCMRDPIYFIENYCVIQSKEGETPFTLYDYQKRMIGGYHGYQEVINLSPRQSGKSWTCGAYFLWYSCFHRDKTLLVASNKNANAKEMIKRVQYMYERLPDWLKPGVVAYNKHDILFDNGSRVISQATTLDTGRGFSIHMLFLDEFAFVPPNIQSELWASLSPTLSASNGSVIICSTPNGDVDIFSQLWRGANNRSDDSSVGANGFFPIDVRWDEVPGRDDEFKQREIAKIGEVRWKQEYECQFISSDPLLIDTLVLANLDAEVSKVEPLGKVNNITIFETPISGATYLITMDPSTGSGEDYTGVQVFRFPEMVQAMEYRDNVASPATCYHIFKKIVRLYEKNSCTVFYTVENNGVGEAILTLIEVDEDPFNDAQMISDSNTNRSGGMTTTHRSKMNACLALKDMIEKGQMTVKSRLLLTELKHFVRSKGSYNAQRGATDDLVSAALLIVRLLAELASFDQDAYDRMYTSEYDAFDYDSDWTADAEDATYMIVG